MKILSRISDRFEAISSEVAEGVMLSQLASGVAPLQAAKVAGASAAIAVQIPFFVAVGVTAFLPIPRPLRTIAAFSVILLKHRTSHGVGTAAGLGVIRAQFRAQAFMKNRKKV